METIESLCARADEALTAAGLPPSGGTFVARSYAGRVGGFEASAALSVFVGTGRVMGGSLGRAHGFALALELRDDLPARWVIGRRVPVLLPLGLGRAGSLEPGVDLRTRDLEWASRLLCDPGRRALVELVAAMDYVEQRPGLLQAKLVRFGSNELPEVGKLLRALELLARTSREPPAPRPSPARLTDRPALMLALLAAAVVAVFVALAWWLTHLHR